MKLAFIEAFSGQIENYVFYPLGIASIEAYINEKLPEIETKVCDTIDAVLEFCPDVVGVSATSPHYFKAIEIAEIVKKELGIKVFLGGPHISSLPESLNSIFSAGIIGEGEIVFSKIIENLLKKGTIEELTKLKGLVFYDSNERLVNTGKSEFIKDIDSLPFSNRYWAKLPYFHNMFSSRGCPFKCNFCSSAHIWETCRFYSPQRVAKELRFIINELDVKFVSFMDDLFAVNLQRVKKIAKAIEFTRDVIFACTLRADNCSKKLTDSLFNMGVRYVQLGIESASPKILPFLKGGKSSPSENEKALIDSHESGLHNTGSFIIGSPQEDEEDIKMTYNFIKSSLKSGILNEFLVAPIMAFPGTYFWDYACRKGLIDPFKMDWGKLCIKTDGFDPKYYVFLSEKLSLKRFAYHLKRFKELHDEFVT